MDSIFLLGEADRAAFLQHMMQSFGCAYICLWSNLPLPSNCLQFLDGLYHHEDSQQPNSSSGSLAIRLFNEYCGSVNYIDHGCVPGFAFKNSLPYMDMNLDCLERLASSEVQLQFYQEAGIKAVVFMGCTTGEIELGFSSEPQVNLEIEMKYWFPVDFSRQRAPRELPQPTNCNLPPTSSSLGSLSVDSIEYSPSLFNVQSTSFIREPPREALIDESLLQEALRSVPISAPISTSPDHQQAIRALSQIRNIQFPIIENGDAAITRAILAVLSPPSTSSSSQQTAQNLPPISPTSHKRSAFRSYRAALAPVAAKTQKHNLFKRAVLFFRNLNVRRRQELMQIQRHRHTTTQVHHVIQERRRREKINKSFQVLRSLLPQVSKKDKASILSSTNEYLSSLKSQAEELRRRNHILEKQLSTTQREAGEEVGFAISSTEGVNVEIAHVSPSTSEARFLDVRVSLRSGECSSFDLVIRILNFLKQQRNESLLSVQSNTRMAESTPVHDLVLRLKVEGDVFDESGFREAMKRVVDDLPH